MLPHQTQIKICPYISLGINSHSQIATVKLGQEDSPVSSWPHEKCVPLDSARKATSLHPKDPIPASSNLPCFSKRKAKLFTEPSVSGCWAPSWDWVDFQGSAAETFCLAARDGALRCRNMRRAPAQAPCVMEREEKPTKATIFGL